MPSTNEGLKAIAERVHALVSSRYGERVLDAAVGLGISDMHLSLLLQGRAVISMEVLAEVLARVVRHFGVDPSWLVTGRYDLRSHVAAEEHGIDPIGLRFQIRRLLSGPDRSVELRAIKGADLHRLEDRPSSTEGWAEPSAQVDSLPGRTSGRSGADGEPER